MGCMSDWADNYDELATTDNESCYRNGCMYPLMANYDSLATQDPNLSCNFNQDTLDFEVNLITTDLSLHHSYEIDSINSVYVSLIDSLELEISNLNQEISDLNFCAYN